MRKILFVGLLLVAVLGPYLYSKSATFVKESGGTAGGVFSRLTGGAETDSSRSMADGSLLAEFPSTETTPLTDGPGLPLVDLLRFDVKPEWVTQHWKQITADLPGTRLNGMRVPLVTGTGPQDVVGSLSYYFNSSQQLERIGVHGFCEDPSSVLLLLEQRFGLKRDTGAGPNTYVAFYDEQPISLLRLTSHAPQTGEDTESRYEIDLELNLPRKGALLSGEKLMILFQGYRGGVS